MSKIPNRPSIAGRLLPAGPVLTVVLWAAPPAPADTTPPSNPTALASPSHGVAVWSNDATVGVEWSGASDGESGLAGYSVAFDGSDPAAPPAFAFGWGNQGGDVAVDGRGNIYTVDAINHRVQKFDPDGSLLLTWGSFGSGPGEFDRPQSVASDRSGNVYVADTGNYQIQRFDSDGTFLLAWGTFGEGDGQFHSANGVAADRSGNVYVTDVGNHRIQKFDAAGSFLTKWGSPGSGNGQFSTPLGVAADSSDNIYVADTNNHRIQKFDASGTFLLKWGSHGSGDGQFDHPHGLALNASGLVHVADTDNHRIQVFRPPGLPDATVDVTHTADPHATISSTLPDGDGHFFHLRTCDNAGNCSGAVHLGPFWIDTTAPDGPATVESTSHTVGVPSSEATIDMSWSPATDATSGVDGYAYAFNTTPTPTCDETLDLEETETAVSSGELADGAWHFHLCTVDHAGNWTPASTTGPYPIDATHPRVASVDSVASAGSGGLGDFTGPLTQILLGFDEAMDAALASDPANYLLVEGGADGAVTTAACGPLDGDDQALPLALADYHPPSTTAHLHPVGTTALPAGSYRGFACAALRDAVGNPLDGDGDGDGGDDFDHGFAISLTDELANPNFDADLSGWTLESAQPSEIVFSTDDADGAASSGSVAVENLSGPDATFALGQCLPLSPGRLSEARGRFRVATATAGVPLFLVHLSYFATSDCSGDPVAATARPVFLGDTAGAWMPFERTGFRAPAVGVGSVLVEYVLDAGGEPLLEAGLDALHFGATSILFADGFESGDTVAWSSTVP